MRDQKQTGLILNASKGQTIELQSVTNDEVRAVFTWNDRKIPTGWVIVSSAGGGDVTVQWYIDFHLRWYPWEKFTSFLFEKIYEPQLKQGVEQLKIAAEQER
jgi:hypothetical protein